ncbi:MAG: glutamate--tRNA ligase [Campylobacter sp.]|nr:glutamate--tRNA ligase [Campylobacter sp.]
MQKNIVTRFAPSPTGYLHIGGLRTALYSYLYARGNGGKFLLRIEDTDLKRNKEEATKAIIEAFHWTGLDWDGDVVYQSDRFDIYKSYIDKLLKEGKAYKCYMSKDELDALRNEQIAKKERPRYDGRYRDFKGEPPANIEPVIRIKAPTSGIIEFKDGVKGDISFEAADILDDFIIARSDGTPIYNFTVVVDDALMGVSDVIRGDDHLSNTPKQIVLYNALGFKIPNFYNVAMINGPDGQKLSKRHGATDVMEYKNMGYLSEGLLNFLVRLGWSHGDDEIFSMKELKELFDPHNLSKSASTFNQSKLEWLNQHYIKEASLERIIHELKGFGLNLDECKKANILIDSLRERSVTLLQMMESARSILYAPTTYQEKAYKKFIKAESLELLVKFSEIFGDENLDAKGYEEITMKFLDKQNMKLKDIAQPLRIAITGNSVSPGIFEVIEVIGIKELKKRIEKLLEFSKNGQN